jgi:hypothetical protein
MWNNMKNLLTNKSKATGMSSNRQSSHHITMLAKYDTAEYETATHDVAEYDAQPIEIDEMQIDKLYQSL